MTEKCLLIVDDHESLRRVLRTLFGRAGIDSDEAADGVEAMKLLRDKSYNVVLLDLIMPNANGADVIEYMRSHAIETPVVVMTAADVPEGEAMASPPVTHVLRKPFDTKRMVKDVLAMCDDAPDELTPLRSE